MYNIPCDCGNVTLGKQADLWKYILRSTNITSPKICLRKIKISPTCIGIRPQNMLERSEGLAD
jgi:hypothetical protein